MENQKILLDRNEVAELLRCSRRQTYVLDLPKPIQIGNSASSKKLWKKEEVINWIGEQR